MKNIIERYGYYLDPIRRLSKVPLSVMPMAKDLGITKSMMQASYREMKELRFPGSTVDFVSWVAAMYELDRRLGDFEFESDKVQERFINGLESNPDAAAVLTRGVWFIRLADLEMFRPGERQEVFRADEYNIFRRDQLIFQAAHWLMEFSRLIELFGSGNKSKLTMEGLEKLGCNRLTKRILEYQSVTTGSDPPYNTTQPQSTNQSNKRKKATLPAREK